MSYITDDIDKVVECLKAGQVVALPTETVYGLAAAFDNIEAIQEVFAIKKRPTNHPLILHVLPEWNLYQWVDAILPLEHDLIAQYWPGPLTMVFPTNTSKISPVITGGQTTVAIRAPNHPVMMTVLEKLGKPLVAPSANPFAKISPTMASHVLDHFPDIDLPILEGGRCQVGLESTIVRVNNQQIEVLRPGTIRLEDATLESNDKEIRVPGKMDRHYQPAKPLYYFTHATELPDSLQDFYVMGFNDNHFSLDYRFPEDWNQACHEFYYQLQVAAQSDKKAILIELPSFTTLKDKITRAGQPIIKKK